MVVVSIIATFFLRHQASFQIKKLFASSPQPVITSDRQIRKTLPNQSAGAKPRQVDLNNPSSAQITTPENELSRRNRALSDLAKMSLKQTQAKDLSLAIATAKKIKPGDTLYPQAQENIQIWSRMILDLAESRAKKRQYGNAIAAATLISNNEPLYPQAQAAINQWRLDAKEYVSNKTLLDAANALIQPGQASTYNRAIEVAKRVPSAQPGFDLAQKSINKWSEKILDLAKSRAAQGELSAAIETAALVPEVTAAYEDAQDAIQKWQMRRIKR
jgi:hypothetical protein